MAYWLDYALILTIVICICKLPLFTGRIGGSNNIEELLLMLFLNVFGVLIIKLLFSFNNMFTLGVGCGILMQIAVTAYKKNIPILTAMCVMAFILAGYKHCIANIYNSLDIMNFVLILLGNIVGAKICYYGGVKS